jgi:hypothetical protein
MLRFAQHDKSDSVIPSESEESMTLFVLAKADASLRLRFVQNDKSRSVTPNACEESIVWMLRFAQHDKLGSWIPHFADASLSMTRAVSFRAHARNPVWMLRFAQHDKSGVIPSESEESMTLFVLAKADASLRCASFSMTRVSADIGTIGSSQYECARGAVHRRGLEPPTARVEIWCSIQLSYRCRHEGVTKLSRTYNKSMICA